MAARALVPTWPHRLAQDSIGQGCSAHGREQGSEQGPVVQACHQPTDGGRGTVGCRGAGSSSKKGAGKDKEEEGKKKEPSAQLVLLQELYLLFCVCVSLNCALYVASIPGNTGILKTMLSTMQT